MTFAAFDKKIDDSKSASQAALRMIPDIEEKIREAEDRTSDARNNLADAEADANAARDIASEAEDVAKMASEVSAIPGGPVCCIATRAGAVRHVTRRYYVGKW